MTVYRVRCDVDALLSVRLLRDPHDVAWPLQLLDSIEATSRTFASPTDEISSSLNISDSGRIVPWPRGGGVLWRINYISEPNNGKKFTFQCKIFL